MASALTPVDPALLPANVRAAGPEAQKLYQAALAFESVLTQQLAQALTSTLETPGSDGSDGSDDGSSPDAATALTAQMLPGALSQSLAAAGGIGLAPQLYEALGGPALSNGTGRTDAGSAT